jgi:protein-tyrosine kinase
VDKIRKALDLARLERARSADAPVEEVIPPLEGTRPANAHRPGSASARVAPEQIVYSKTRVFQPSAQLLEANRIMNPVAADPGAAAYRMLRTQVLQRMNAHGWRSLAIFSPMARDGKTTIAINLALSLASDLHHTALVIDFDFRRPSLAAKIGLAPEAGADDVLTSNANVEDCLYHPQGFDRFVVLPTRAALPHSSELLAGPSSRMLVAELRSRYPERFLVFDLPPVLSSDDALAFAPLVDCGLVVAAEGRTKRKDLVRTVELLHNTPLVGTVLNRASSNPSSY